MEQADQNKDFREELEELDAKVMKLRIDYEQYFMRIQKREPLFLRQQVEKTVHFYTLQHITNTGDKFKFRNIADKYNSFKLYWNRTIKEIEEGTYKRRSEDARSTMKVGVTMKSGAVILPLEEEVSSAPVDEAARIKKLHEDFIRARKECNETSSNIGLDYLAKAVEQQRAAAKKKFGTDDFDFDVKIKEGKARIVLKKKKP